MALAEVKKCIKKGGHESQTHREQVEAVVKVLNSLVWPEGGAVIAREKHYLTAFLPPTLLASNRQKGNQRVMYRRAPPFSGDDIALSPRGAQATHDATLNEMGIPPSVFPTLVPVKVTPFHRGNLFPGDAVSGFVRQLVMLLFTELWVCRSSCLFLVMFRISACMAQGGLG